MASPRKSQQSVYRIVSKKYPPFDGSGAYQWGSRWVDPGRQVVHASSSYSLAILENLVHWQSTALPPALVCVVATIPDAIKQLRKSPKNIQDISQCRDVGNQWFDKAESAILWVPSVVSPFEDNVLINQLHPDFSKLLIAKPISTVVDSRLI